MNSGDLTLCFFHAAMENRNGELKINKNHCKWATFPNYVE